MCCRQRKDELEQRMSSLQESRRELMVQLEGLMKLLKVTHSHTDCLLFSSMVYCRTWEGKVSLVSSHLLKSVLASLLPLAVSSF